MPTDSEVRPGPRPHPSSVLSGWTGRLASSTAVDLYVLAAGTIVYQGGRLLLSLVAAAVLGPEAFGTWTLFLLLVLYSNFISLGTANGAGRQVPYLLGAGRGNEADRTEDVTLGMTAASAIVAVVVALAIGPTILGPMTTPSVALLLALAVLLQQFFLLQQVLLRSRFRYRPAAVQNVVLGVATVLIGVPLVLWLGLLGLAVAQVAVFAIAVAVAARVLYRVPRPAWDRTIAHGLVMVGFPIMVSAMLFALLTTIDRWLILALLGRIEVGLYGLIAIAISGLLLVPAIVSQQFYPRLAHSHGAGAAGRSLVRLAVEQSVITTTFVGVGAILVVVAAVVGIPRFLPAYASVIEPMIIAVIGLCVYGIGSGFGSFLTVAGAQWRLLAILAATLVVDVGLAVPLIVAGNGIIGVASATTVAMTVYSVLVVTAAWRLSVRITGTPDRTDVTIRSGSDPGV